MSDIPTREPEDHGALTAAEYVLGVLGAGERRAAEARIVRDAAFAREVAFWEARLAPLAEGVAPVTPPDDAWDRIEARLVRQATSAEPKRGLWNNLPLWRGLALASGALAAACIAALAFLADLPERGQPLVATLDEQSGHPGFVAAANPSDGSLTIVPAALLGQAQHSLELWVIPPGGKPHSLGLVDPDRPVKVQIPPELLPHVSADSVLAISLEPLGGSPTGQPTGPVVANGKLAQL
ncbi:MAG: anti-sigma factor [Hyphomicrobiales bacterium]